MYKQIVNPATGRKVNVDGKIGQQVLQQYKEQLGGEPPIFGTKLSMPKFLRRKNPGLTTRMDETGDEFINTLKAKGSEETGTKYNIHNKIKQIIKATCAKNPIYVLVDNIRQFNLNSDCYESKLRENENIFWEQFRIYLEKSAISRLEGWAENFIQIKRYVLSHFTIVKLKVGKKGVYGNECSTGLTKSFTKWGSRNTTAARKSFSNAANAVGQGYELIKNDPKQAATSAATNLRKSVGKAATTTIQGFTKAKIAAKRGITDWHHHQGLGKNNYVKSLILEIRNDNNAIDEIRSNMTPGDPDPAAEAEIEELQKKRRQKLIELQKIDEKYVVLSRDRLSLDLPEKSIDCHVKTILKNEYGKDNKLIEVCSCNGAPPIPHADFERQFGDMSSFEQGQHAVAAVVAPTSLARGKARAAAAAAQVDRDLYQGGGGKRRNTKRTSKKRNASKKRRNASKNNNRR